MVLFSFTEVGAWIANNTFLKVACAVYYFLLVPRNEFGKSCWAGGEDVVNKTLKGKIKQTAKIAQS